MNAQRSTDVDTDDLVEWMGRRAPEPAREPRRGWSTARDAGTLCVVLATSIFVGNLVAVQGDSLLHNRMLPWILGRTLGIAAYVALSALVALGIWFRHPWRPHGWHPRPEALLRAHAVLAASTVTLLAGHVTALAMDHYAGVGWNGTFVPWSAQYRPTAVALGTVALYGIMLVTATAVLAGSFARRIWLPVHLTSTAVFAIALVHGLLAGSDTHALRWLYVMTGLLVFGLILSRWIARRTLALESG